MGTPPLRLPSVTLAFLLCGLVAGVALAQDAPKVAGTDVPPPKRTKLVLPEYPAEAQEKGLHGIVILEVLIDTHGKVADAKVIRSIPPFDESALAAVRHWEYEVTKVGGSPVSVLLTVPITFALRVPEVSRQEGIPELRAGMAPAYPKDARGPGRVALQVTLDAEGRIADAELLAGDSPFREAMLAALRSWRFAAPGEGVQVSFRIEAEFEGERRGAPEKISLRLSGLRRSENVAATPIPEPPAAASPTPVPPATASTDAPAAQPSPGASAPPEPPPAPSAAPTAAPSPAAAAPATPAPPAGAPAGPGDAPKDVAPAPPMEVLTAPPPPRPAARPPVAGSSAIENVTLGIGVPDLAAGRRPVLPPLARMSGATGSVEVRFAVNAAGVTTVLNVEGTDAFKAAAQGAVTSWNFRRTTTERLYLTAVFVYETDAAKASVAATQEEPPSTAAPGPAPTPAGSPSPAPSPAPGP